MLCSLRFVSADILLRLVRDLSPAKAKVSEVFCTVTCVDSTGAPVGTSSGSVYRTNGAEMSSSVSWGQEAVLDKASGFLRAVYVHIEARASSHSLHPCPLCDAYLVYVYE